MMESPSQPRAVMTACYGLAGAVNALWGAALPAVDARLSLGPGRLGTILMAVAVGGLCAMPVAGRLADRYTGSRLLLAAGPAAALALLGPAAAGSFAALLPAAALLGVLFGMLNMALSVQAVAVERALDRPIMSTLHGTWTFGAVAGGAAVSWTLHAGVDVRALTAVGAPLLSIALCLIAAKSAPLAAPAPAAPSDRLVSKSTRERSGLAKRSKPVAVLGLGLVGAAAFVSEGAATDWSGVHATRVLGASAAMGSLVYTAFFAAMTLARFAGDALRARLGAAAAVTTGGYVASCGYGLVLVSGALPGAVSTKVACALTGWVLAGIGMAVVWPVVLSTLGTAGRSAAFLSTVATISYGGGLAGPALIGTLAQALSLPLALTVPAALAVVVALAAPRLLAAAVVTAARGGSPTQGPWPPGAAGAQAAAEPSADDGQCLTAVAGAGCSVQP